MTPASITLELPFIPASLKNDKARSRRGYRKSDRVKNQTAAIQCIAMEHLAQLGLHRDPDSGLFGSNNVRSDLLEFPREDRVVITITDLGAPPKGPTGRGRDLGNIDALVHDALQRILYRDDSQFTEIHSHRLLEESER